MYGGWNFLCCDRQNDPSGLSGLQLKERCQVRDWTCGPSLRTRSFHASGVGATWASAEMGEG